MLLFVCACVCVYVQTVHTCSHWQACIHLYWWTYTHSHSSLMAERIDKWLPHALGVHMCNVTQIKKDVAAPLQMRQSGSLTLTLTRPSCTHAATSSIRVSSSDATATIASRWPCVLTIMIVSRISFIFIVCAWRGQSVEDDVFFFFFWFGLFFCFIYLCVRVCECVYIYTCTCGCVCVFIPLSMPIV